MNVSFFGYDKSSEKLCDFLMQSGIEIKGVFDLSLQKSVEFAAKSDSKAFTDIDEGIDKSDIIFLADNQSLRKYLSLLSDKDCKNKILCLISSGNTSDKIYTKELNTHISLYSPYLLSDKCEKNPDINLIIEGFGIKYGEFQEFLTNNSIAHSQINIDLAKEFFSIINLFTNGMETLTKIAEDKFLELNIKDNNLTSELIKGITCSDNLKGSFFTNETHTVIKTMDTLKSISKHQLLPLYKIIGLNSLEYGGYNKDEKEHFRKIIVDKEI